MDICAICFGDNADEAVVLVNCLHTICRSCIARSLVGQESFKCPLGFCNAALLEEEVQMAIEKGYDEGQVVPGNEAAPQEAPDVQDMEIDFVIEGEEGEGQVKCAVCLDFFKASDVIVLESCFHCICKNCVRVGVRNEEAANVRCPMMGFMGCKGILTQQEIKASVTEHEFDEWLDKSVNAVRQEMNNIVTCATPNCNGWYEAEEGRNIFQCAICNAQNCNTCKAIHDELDCDTYQDLINSGADDIPSLMERVKKSGWVQLKQMVLAHGPEVLDKDLMTTVTDIQCVICYNTIPPGDGIILHDCLHTSCRECLVNVINHCEGPEVTCPFTDGNISCENTLKPREIKALVSAEELDRLMSKVALVAEGITPNAFHCLTVDCPGWCEVASKKVKNFRCYVCDKNNCFKCKDLHEGPCVDFKKLAKDADKKSEKELESLMRKKKVQKCPKCSRWIMKNGGCPFMKCTVCKTRFVWQGKPY